MSESVWLERPSGDVPWGFRLHGGRDFRTPLTVQKVTGGSVAASRLQAGDLITSIGDDITASLTHSQAMQVIKDCGNTLRLGITRAGAAAGARQFSPQTSVTSPATDYAPASQSPYEHYQPSYQTSAPAGYSDVPTPGSQYGQGSVTTPVDYPFTMQPYAETNYPVTPLQDYSLDDDSVMTNSWMADEPETPASPPRRAPSQRQPQPQQPATPQVPDAVINMAAKVGSDKKPFAYIADVNDIQQQRDRVRRKQPASALPRYQHMLNLPQFEEQPPARTHGQAPGGPSAGTPTSPQAGESDTAMVANLQYNTPMGMYSGENVMEALQGQTGGQIKDVVGLPKTDKSSDYTQSAVYKMIHGIDQPRPRPRPTPEERPTARTREPTEEELKFTGLSRGEEIPSKSFQRLQSWTGADQSGSEPGQYDQKSIRYTGRNIPSRSFRILQNMTGGPDAPAASSSPAPASDDELSQKLRSRSETPQKPVHRSEGQGQGQVQTGGSEIDTSSYRHNLLGTDDSSTAAADVGDYDQTSIRYTGRNIPSRSFRMLQHLTGSGDESASPPPAASRPSPRRQPAQSPQPRRIQMMAGGGAASVGPGAAGAPQGSTVDANTFEQQQPYYNGANVTPLSHDLPDATAVNGAQSDVLQSTTGRKVKVVRLRQQASLEAAASVESDQGATEF